MTSPTVDRVREVRTEVARLALPVPLLIGSTRVIEREYATVHITTDDGLVGKAYCLSRSAPVSEIIDRLIAPHVVGAPRMDVQALWDRVLRATAMVGRVGLVRRAHGLVDIALWDIAAQRQGLPLWQLLGRPGTPRTTMLVAAYPTPDRSARSVADEVLAHAANGWPLLKVARTPDSIQMAEIVSILSRELPSTSELVVDASFGWTSADHALSEIQGWTDARIAWLEDPLLPEDTAAYVRLREGTHLRIGAGDEVTDPAVLHRLVDHDALDVVRVDVVALGGVTPTMEVIDTMQRRGIPVSAHVYPEVTVHLGVDVETFPRGPEPNPYDPAPTLIVGGPSFAQGHSVPTTTPGLGFTLDTAYFTQG